MNNTQQVKIFKAITLMALGSWITSMIWIVSSVTVETLVVGFRTSLFAGAILLLSGYAPTYLNLYDVKR
mgnify:CR=1 FL=1